MIERNRFSYEQVFSWHTIKYKSSLGTSNEELANFGTTPFSY